MSIRVRGALAGALVCLVALLDCDCPRAQGPLGAGGNCPSCGPEGPTLGPTFDLPAGDSDRLVVGLERVASGLPEITDLQFPPGRSDLMLVLQKSGTIVAVDLAAAASVAPDQRSRVVARLAVSTRAEEGLLGLAFHPRWPQDPRVFIDQVVRREGGEATRISAYDMDPTTLALSRERVLLQVDQPFANHNAGQLAFGPEGDLYVGLGDGGSGGDPSGNGQNPSTLLGSMLRLDVDHPAAGQPYGIPADNPFLGVAGARPELFAIGLRNPWRFSFDPKGRLVVADVGQDTWEEVDLVPPGANLGWNRREGRHCFPASAPSCDAAGLVEPVWEYSHAWGHSVTGGYVYTGSAVPALAGRYLVGDFLAGRIWALTLPDAPGQPGQASFLGTWPLAISTFGRDGAGEIYVAGFQKGAVYRIVPLPS